MELIDQSLDYYQTAFDCFGEFNEAKFVFLSAMSKEKVKLQCCVIFNSMATWFKEP